MKSKKILSILLAVVMLASVMSICAYAEDAKIYKASASYALNAKAAVDPATFSATVDIDRSKISALDGGTPDVEAEITSLVATYNSILTGETISADYITSAEDFFALFTTVAQDIAAINEYNAGVEDSEKLPDASPVDLTVKSDIIVNDPLAFGTLEYTINVVGFSEALEIGLGPVDDLLANVKLPVTIAIPGNAPDFPAVESMVVIERPSKREYTDAEKYDATGLVLGITTTTGQVGTFTYSAETDHMFFCTPTNKENLTTYDTEVAIAFNGEQICKMPVLVDHQWTENYVCITTDKYSEFKPGYHAIVCEGCGETKDAQNHSVDPEAWVSNGDQTFLKNGTESTTCLDCGATLTRDAFHTADYNEDLANYHFIQVILDYINFLLRIIDTSIN